jgi:hypothetical protein
VKSDRFDARGSGDAFGDYALSDPAEIAVCAEARSRHGAFAGRLLAGKQRDDRCGIRAATPGATGHVILTVREQSRATPGPAGEAA